MMRLAMVAILLGGSVGLCGCNAAPPDPYSGMRMLTPAEVGAPIQEEDPVLEAEKAHNAKFVPKDKRSR